MSYIGGVSTGYNSQQTVKTQSFNGDSSNTVFTLNYHVNQTNDIEVLVNNVQQSPFDGSYSAAGNVLTFSSPPSTGSNNIYVVYRTYSIPNYFRANTTVEGVVLLVDSVTNSSISQAATANSVKTAYDAIAAVSGNVTTAYTNAVSEANTLAFNFAANAYANATSYTDSAIANLVNSAPTTLDTLQELANALGNDANFSTTVLTGIGNAYTNAVNQATTLSNNAYANAIAEANTLASNFAANAYSNATAYASNGTNITTGTVNASLLSTSGVVANTYGNTTAIPVLEINDKGIVVNATTSSISGVTGLSYTASNSTITVSTSTTSYNAQITALNIGNSTVNTAINSTAVVIDGTLDTGNTNVVGTLFANGELVVANSTSNVFSVASNGNVVAGGSVFARSPFFENATEVLSNYTIAANVNAMSVGPLTVANGVAVTVSSGSRWVII